MNTREKAVIDLIAHFKRMDFSTQDDFLREVFKRMPDMNVFALYVEVFGYPVKLHDHHGEPRS